MSDFSDLDRLAADLSNAGAMVGAKAFRLLDETGAEIREEARRLAPGAHGGPARHYPKTISHETTVGADRVEVEIGPEKGGQGSLGHLFENGVPSTGAPPQAHLGPALDRSVPGFVVKVADLGGEIL